MPLRGKILNTWEVGSGRGAAVAGSARHRGRAWASIRASAISSACAITRSASSRTPTPTGCTSPRCCARCSCGTSGRWSRQATCSSRCRRCIRIDVGKQIYYALDDAERDGMLEGDRAREDQARKPYVTRFKGLGEMNPLAAARDHHGSATRAGWCSSPSRPRTRADQIDGHAARQETRVRPPRVAGREGQPGRRAGPDRACRHASRTELRRHRAAAAAHVHREGVPRLFDVRRCSIARCRSSATA